MTLLTSVVTRFKKGYNDHRVHHGLNIFPTRSCSFTEGFYLILGVCGWLITYCEKWANSISNSQHIVIMGLVEGVSATTYICGTRTSEKNYEPGELRMSHISSQASSKISSHTKNILNAMASGSENYAILQKYANEEN